MSMTGVTPIFDELVELLGIELDLDSTGHLPADGTPADADRTEPGTGE